MASRRRTWGPSGVLWFLICLLAADVRCQGEDRESLVPLQCILMENMPEGCANVTETGQIPDRLAELYIGLNEETKRLLAEGNLRDLSESNAQEIPLPLLYLIPPQNLQVLPGKILAALVKINPSNCLVAAKCAASVSFPERESFIANLEKVPLSEEVQLYLAEILVAWYPDSEPDKGWNFDLFHQLKKIGDTLLAYLPPYFLFDLPEKTAARFLFYMRDWEDFSGTGSNPLDKPWSVKRAWSHLAIRDSFPTPLRNWTREDFERYGYYLTGAMPDELETLRLEGDTLSLLSNMKFNRMQTRSLFNSFAGRSLQPESINSFRPVLQHMTPRDIVRHFVNATDFSLTFASAATESASFPTLKQILELNIMKLVNAGQLPSVNASTWGESIDKLGNLVYVLPNSALKSYKSTTLSLSTLSAIDTEKLSRTQAQYLIAGSNSSEVLQLKGLLKGMDASTLSNMNLSDVPQVLLNHVLSSLPDVSKAGSFALLQKIRSDLHADRLRAMIMNKNPNQFFGLLSSLDVSANLKQIKALFQTLKESHLIQSAKKLSPLMLSVLLSNARESMVKDKIKWTSQSIFSSSSGLNIASSAITCNDVKLMDTVDLVSIIGTFNKERRSLQKKFPKDLQYCLQEAVVDLLVLKKNLSQANEERPLHTFLEPFEIHALGGHIFASLPKSIIRSLPNFGFIKAIGSLSIPEIFLATSGRRPSMYARMLTEELLSSNNRYLKITARELFTLGNLTLFLDVGAINSIDPASFKFFVELLNPRAKTVCAGTRTRNAWSSLIISSFGNPGNWSAGTLATLGDLLLVIPEDQLKRIPTNSWTYASDVLVEETSYHVPMDWPGETAQLPFFQVCSKFLSEADKVSYVASVHMLVRKYLAAVQMLLNTVLPASELLSFLPKTTSKPELRESRVAFGQPIPEIEVIPDSEEDDDDDDDDDDDLEIPSIPNSTDLPKSSMAPGEEVEEHVREKRADIHVIGETLKDMVKHIPGVHVGNRIFSRSTKQEVSCDAIRTTGLLAGIALEPEDISGMSVDELENCVETLGSVDLSSEVKDTFWNTAQKRNLSVELATAGSLLSNIPVDLVSNLEFIFPSSLEVFSSLGAEVTNKIILREMTSRFLLNNSEPTTWRADTVAAMGHMTCLLANSYLERSLGRGDMFVETLALVSSSVKDDCSILCLEDLAHIAKKSTSYGHPGRWTAEDLMSLGVIVAGLSANDLASLSKANGSNNPIIGLQPSAVRCMPPSSFQVLTLDQISSLPPMAVAMVTTEQMNLLSAEKKTMLTNILLQVPKRELLQSLHETEEDSDEGVGATRGSNTFLLLLCILLMSIFHLL